MVATRQFCQHKCKAEAVTTENYDLIIVGSGSGNSLISDEMDDWRIAIVERWTFGGTCLNRGCVPSKMFVYAADVAESAANDNGPKYGVTTNFESADWPSMVRRVFGRIDPIASGGLQYRYSLPHVTVYEGNATFVGERTMEVNGETITGDRIVLATGARSFIPNIHGIDEVPYHTSDTIMRIAHQPKHLVVLGGGFIAAELSHVFRSFGSRVTIINRGHKLLRAEDHDISTRYTELAAERFELLLGATIPADLHDRRGRRSAGDHRCGRHDSGRRHPVGGGWTEAQRRRHRRSEGRYQDRITRRSDRRRVRTNLSRRRVGTGRRQWSLPVEAHGQRRGKGHSSQPASSRRSAAARHSTRPARGLRQPADRLGRPDRGSGRELDRPISVVTYHYSGSAYGWALEDTTSLCKLIGDPSTRTLLGAHVIGYQASVLVQLFVQGMHLGNTVDQMATGQIWIHPALSEVVEQSLLKLIAAFDDA